MVKVSLVFSALFALTAVVSAVPLGLLDRLTDDELISLYFDYIGTGDIETGDIAPNAVQVNEPEIHDVANGVDVL